MSQYKLSVSEILKEAAVCISEYESSHGCSAISQAILNIKYSYDYIIEYIKLPEDCINTKDFLIERFKPRNRDSSDFWFSGFGVKSRMDRFMMLLCAVEAAIAEGL